MHILDFLFYFPLLLLVWKIIDKTSDGYYTDELGVFVGFTIALLFTIIYIILFAVYPDWNWVDIINSAYNFIKNFIPSISW